MAAAITAGTRRKLLQAALTAPDAIVSFATDGIVSEMPLKIATSAPGEKKLGEWEHTKTVKDGGVFVQSGFYLLCEDAAADEDGLNLKTQASTPRKPAMKRFPGKSAWPGSCSKTFPLAGKRGSRFMSSIIGNTLGWEPPFNLPPQRP